MSNQNQMPNTGENNNSDGSNKYRMIAGIGGVALTTATLFFGLGRCTAPSPEQSDSCPTPSATATESSLAEVPVATPSSSKHSHQPSQSATPHTSESPSVEPSTSVTPTPSTTPSPSSSPTIIIPSHTVEPTPFILDPKATNPGSYTQPSDAPKFNETSPVDTTPPVVVSVPSQGTIPQNEGGNNPTPVSGF